MIQGRYLIVQPIGKGGMGEVYLAVDQRLGSAVALKRTFFSEDSTLGSAFEREARILGRLRHPVLPKVIDHFAENGDQFLVMEHISGDDIAKRLESTNKPFPLSWVMFWADQMLDALTYLHSHEPPIVHRDIKPQNLKLTDDNHIVLLDFGLSKDFDSASSGHGMNSASVAGYSPHFASMEQIRGTGTDARSDLFSLSATLYQMLTNTVPPDALTRADALIGGKNDPLLPLTDLNSEMTTAISVVILKAMSIRQDERFASAAEMQKMLRRAFNKDKPDLDAKPVMSTTNPQQPPTDTSTPKPESIKIDTPEMETRIRADVGVPLDATLQMEVKSTQEHVKQSELKTAVFSVDSAVPEEAKPEPVPLIVPPVPVMAVPVAAVAAPSKSQQPSNFKPQAVPPPVQKKSSSVGLIAGVLVGLLLLAGLGAGAGWYLLNGSNAAATTTTPSPTPNIADSPAILADTNQNVNSNSNTLAASDSNSDAGTSESTTSNISTPGTATTKQTPKVGSPKTAQPPPTKVTPKPKAKDDRTVILQ